MFTDNTGIVDIKQTHMSGKSTLSVCVATLTDISMMLSINDMRTSVRWEEPVFTDNTWIVDIKQTHMSGKSTLSIGVATAH